MHFISSSPAFNDTIDSLKHEFRNDISNSVIICGAHDLSHNENIDKYKCKYDKVIVFNQEPLLAKQRQFMHLGYFSWLELADEVWDYDEVNIKVLRLIRDDIKLHILKPYKKWPETHEKDIDILFYGSMNEHRKKLLDHLSQKHNVCILTNNFDTLDEYILRSKILLNIHYYHEVSLQEQARMIRWIGAPCRIVSERSVNNYLGVEELDYASLFEL